MINKINTFVTQEIQNNKALAAIYNCGNFSPHELLFFFPNNKLKMHGLPLTRGGRYKKIKRFRLIEHMLFKTLDDIIEATIKKEFRSEEFFQRFIDVHDINIGEPNNKTLQFVAEEISEIYNKPYNEAYKIVNQSFLSNLLTENPEFVQHYTADYWAKYIIEGE